LTGDMKAVAHFPIILFDKVMAVLQKLPKCPNFYVRRIAYLSMETEYVANWFIVWI